MTVILCCDECKNLLIQCDECDETEYYYIKSDGWVTLDDKEMTHLCAECAEEKAEKVRLV